VAQPAQPVVGSNSPGRTTGARGRSTSRSNTGRGRSVSRSNTGRGRSASRSNTGRGRAASRGRSNSGRGRSASRGRSGSRSPARRSWSLRNPGAAPPLEAALDLALAPPLTAAPEAAMPAPATVAHPVVVMEVLAIAPVVVRHWPPRCWWSFRYWPPCCWWSQWRFSHWCPWRHPPCFWCSHWRYSWWCSLRQFPQCFRISHRSSDRYRLVALLADPPQAPLALLPVLLVLVSELVPFPALVVSLPKPHAAPLATKRSFKPLPALHHLSRKLLIRVSM
jgi:hypothetical protein